VTRRSPSDPHRAFLTADLLVGLGIVAALGVSLFVTVGRAGRVVSKLSDARAAARAAEAAMADLQAERPLGIAPGMTVTVRPEPDGIPIPGHAWVRVNAVWADQSAELIGLIPDAPPLRQGLVGRTTAPATREGQ
jgi:hypothetical protein